MKKTYIIILSLFLAPFSIYAQSAIEWQKSLGGTGPDQGYSIMQTLDGGYIIAGTALSNEGDVSGNNGYYDYWTVKLNPSNAIEWQKCLGNGGLQEGRAIRQTNGGGFIVAGNTSSGDAGQVTGTHGDEDYWIVKLDASLDTTWTTTLGGTNGDYPASIGQTADGGYIIAGFSQSNNGDVHNSHDLYDAWIVKLNSAGDTSWTKLLGGSGRESANDVKQTSDGGYIVAGYSYSVDGDATGTISANHGGKDYWVVKLNATGNITWERSLGGSGEDEASSIEETTDGGYVVAGYTTSPNDGDVTGNHGYRDYWIVKLSSDGTTIEWKKTYGGTGEDKASSVKQTTDGGFIVAGYTYSNDGDVNGNHGQDDYWLVKLDNNGNFQWQKTYGGSGMDEAFSVEQTSDDGYIVAGRSASNDQDVSGNHGGFDFWVVKLSPDALATMLAVTNTTVVKNITGNSLQLVNSGIYKLVALTPTAGANALSGSVKTSVTVGPTMPNNGKPYVGRYYDIIPSLNANNAQATITLYFTQQEFDDFNTYVTTNSLNIPLLPTGGVDNGNVRITQFHGMFTSTSDPGSLIMPNVVWDNSTQWWVVTFPVTGFSRFFLSTINLTVLPLSLLEFKGKLQENIVALQWLTTNETGTDEFVIERRSQRSAFITIGKVAALSTPGNHQYNFTDEKPLAGNNFYRLKTINKDGHFTYSLIVPVKINDAIFNLSAYPNPAKDILNIKTSSAGNHTITILVTDLSGKVILNKIINIVNGENIIPVNVSKLSAGSYFLKVLSADGKQKELKKFAKQ